MYKKTELPNGVRIVTECMPHVHSVSIGIWITTGSRDENVQEKGLSHFIEHMLFKGTKKRTYLDIARDIEKVGGILNAFTTREYTSIYAKVLDKNFPTSYEILSDIFLNSVFNKDEIAKEKMVVLQEIYSSEDTPEEYIQDLFYTNYFKKHPLGYPIIGSKNSLKGFNSNKIKKFFQKNFLEPSKIIVTAAGNLSHEEVSGYFEKTFGSLKPKNVNSEEMILSISEPIFSVYPKKLEQVHIFFGSVGISALSPKRYSCYLLNTITGGSMSSRLFQEIREIRGLAYSIFSFHQAYRDTGIFSTCVSTSPNKAKEVLKVIMEEYQKLILEPIKEHELLQAKEQLKGNLLLSFESTDGQMTKLAKGEIFFKKYFSIDDIMDGINRVTLEDVHMLAQELFDKKKQNLIILGDLEDELYPFWKELIT
ncbi:MAG: pitrilysin family protein [Thermodesulfobacteriota bacterium]|nr:pitrilysin family protein [Thermodesulfobacteriota bacterium]